MDTSLRATIGSEAIQSVVLRKRRNWIAASRCALLAMTVMGLALPAQAQEFKPIRSLTVTGMAERKVAPDEAHLNVNLNSLNKDLGAAKAEHDKKLKQLLGITGKAGIAESKVRTDSSSIQPDYTYENNQRIFRGYRVQTMLDIEVGDTGKVGTLMEAITNAGFEKNANTEWGNLLNVRYEIADPDALRDAMMVDAIKSARAKAERMASAAGAEIGRVYQVTEGNAPQFNPPMPMMAMARAESAGGMAKDMTIAPPPGEQQVNATVTVTYELKD